MAYTLVGEVANVCDAITGFNQGNITVDDPNVDGGGAVGLKNSGAVQIVATTTLGAGAPYDFSVGGAEEGFHIIMWMAILNIPTATTGLQIYIEDGGSFGTWNVLPLDAPYLGGYALVIIDPVRDFDSATTFSTTGNPAQLNAIDTLGARFDVLGTIMGNFNNCLLDQMTIGLGVRADAGTGGTPNTFAGVLSTDEGTNQWGWWTSTKGAFVGKGKLFLGPESGTATSVFTDADFVVAYAEERVAVGFYEITMRGSNTDVTWSRATIFASNPTQARWSLTVESDTKTFVPTDCNFIGADAITLNNTSTVTGGSMVDCTSLALLGGTLDGVSVIDADTTDGVAFITAQSLDNISNCNFTFSDGHAIELETLRPLAAISNESGVGFTDETTDAGSVATGDITLLPSGTDADEFYIAFSSTFNLVNIDVGTIGVGTYTLTWQYWDGTGWSSLTGLTDGTSDFKTIGSNELTFDIPGDWATTTVNSQGPFYYIRALADTGTRTTAPIGDEISIEGVTFTLTDNTFTGYTDASNDAAIYNNTGGAITINYSGTAPEIRNGTGSSTTLASPITTTIHISDNTGADLASCQVLVEAGDGTGDLPFEATVTITASGTLATVAHTSHGMVTGDKIAIRFVGSDQGAYNGIFSITVNTASEYEYTMGSSPTSPAVVDPLKTNIEATGVVLAGLTDSNGDISAIRTFALDQPIRGKARKSSASPRFKDFPLDGNTIDSGLGLTLNVRLVLDE